MAHFTDLPLDILPLILQHLLRSNYLATTRLVNRSFDTFAAPRLFEQILIYAWHKDAKKKVSYSVLVHVFATYLSVCI